MIYLKCFVSNIIFIFKFDLVAICLVYDNLITPMRICLMYNSKFKFFDNNIFYYLDL